MSFNTPPWCLQWSSDGELVRPDRQELLMRIMVQEKGLAHALLAERLRTIKASDPQSTVFSTQITPRR